jgi:hypothetical protein
VKADLASAYEDAIRRRDVIKMDVDATSDGEDITFTARDGTQLAELTKRLETLWLAPTTTTEDRKQLLRLVLDRVIVVISTPEHIDLELVWTGGLRERLQIQRRAELDTKVRALQQTGKEPGDIVDALQAARIPQHDGQAGITRHCEAES